MLRYNVVFLASNPTPPFLVDLLCSRIHMYVSFIRFPLCLKSFYVLSSFQWLEVETAAGLVLKPHQREKPKCQVTAGYVVVN